MLTITTDVYTLDELIQRGDESAVDRALEWMQEAWDDTICEEVSDWLTECISDALGQDSLTVDAWDYYRGYVEVSGNVRVGHTRIMEDGPLAGMSVPGADLIYSFTYCTQAARDYGRCDDLWLYLREDAPFGWADPEYDALCDEVSDFVREVEQRLAQAMRSEYEYLTSRERLMELAQVNQYTFSADGKRFG